MNTQKHRIILNEHIIPYTDIVPIVPTSSHLFIAGVNEFGKIMVLST
ncbi:hypothetical protein SAMN04515695_0190 [Pseudovibrio sp. Tun.PSC04-5.I4]|nr:hypothetical protein SAMN04515695_0190 [Pseudovibrio sp. Tun.PSC04-5.I4]